MICSICLLIVSFFVFTALSEDCCSAERKVCKEQTNKKKTTHKQNVSHENSKYNKKPKSFRFPRPSRHQSRPSGPLLKLLLLQSRTSHMFHICSLLSSHTSVSYFCLREITSSRVTGHLFSFAVHKQVRNFKIKAIILKFCQISPRKTPL